MLKKILLGSLLFFISVSILYTLQRSGRSHTQYYIIEAYQYPVVPGTQEWGALRSRDEMLAVAQIPKDIYLHMTTAALLQSILDYPLLNDYLAFSTIPEVGAQGGFNELVNNFPAAAELLSRKDLLHVILERFNDYEIAEENLFLDMHLEMLLTQGELLSNASTEQKKQLFSILKHKLYARFELPEIFGALSFERSMHLLAKMLLLENHLSQSCMQLLDQEAIQYLLQYGDLISETDSSMSYMNELLACATENFG